MEESKFLDQFNGYSRIEYLSVFISFLYALVISEFFVGWSRMVRNRDHLKLSLDHLLYSLIFFWMLIMNWYFLWGRMPMLNRGFLYFVLIITPIAISYFASVLFFPDLDKITDLRTYFDQNFKIIGTTLSLFVLVNMLVGFGMKEEVVATPTIIKSVNIILIFCVAFFGLKKLRRWVALIIGMGLLYGSIHIAFI